MTNAFEKATKETNPEFIEANIVLDEGRNPESFPDGKENETRDGFSFYMWREDKENSEKSGWAYIASKIKEGDEEEPILTTAEKDQFSEWSEGRIIALPSTYSWSEKYRTWELAIEKTDQFKEFTFGKIIFLDIDGVLNSLESDQEIQSNKLEPEAVQILRDIVEANNAQLVISSTRRSERNWQENIRNDFAEAGWEDPPIIDKTPLHRSTEEYGRGRGNEIQRWLEENPTQSYIVLDDDPDEELYPEPIENLVKCDMSIGLSAKQAEEIGRIWQKKAVGE